MSVRPRSLLLALALGFGALVATLASPASAAPAQDDVTTTTTPATFGGGGAATTVATTTEAVAEEPTAESSQQVTEGSSSDQRLLTESRKLMATIGGLVIAAFGLSLLTLRYYRATKPLAPATSSLATNVPLMGTEAALAAASSGSTPVVDPEEPDSLSVEPVSAPTPAVVVESDHRRADSDYEPHGTGEHDRVEIAGPTNRPGRSARAVALGRTSVG